jgi:DNA invertase Pin-like site-specific DNA recombinase
MKYGYARISTDGQSVAAQVAALKAAGSGKVFREVESGAKSDLHSCGRQSPRSRPAT